MKKDIGETLPTQESEKTDNDLLFQEWWNKEHN